MVGFEPTPSERNRFQVYRLNHSATSAVECWDILSIYLLTNYFLFFPIYLYARKD